MKAKRTIRNFLSEALVLDTISKTAMYMIKAMITVAIISHKIKSKVSGN